MSGRDSERKVACRVVRDVGCAGPDTHSRCDVTRGDDSQWIIVNDDDDELAVTAGDPHQLGLNSSFAFSELFFSQLSFRSGDRPRLVPIFS